LAADHLGAQSRDLGLQREQARLDFADAGGETRLIEPCEDLPRTHAVTFVHQELVQHAAVNGLNDLHPSSGNDLALRTRHLVDLKNAGPKDERGDADRENDQQGGVTSEVRSLQAFDPPSQTWVVFARRDVKPHRLSLAAPPVVADPSARGAAATA